MQALDLETFFDFVRENGYGFVCVKDSYNKKLFASNAGENVTANTSLTPDAMTELLKRRMTFLPDGYYRAECKRNPSDSSDSEKCFHIPFFKNENQKPNQFQGMPQYQQQPVDIEARIAEVITRERERVALEKKIEDLERKLSEPSEGTAMKIVKELNGTIAMIGLGLAAKFKPELVPAIQGFLGMNATSTNEPKDEPTVKRPHNDG